METLKQLLAFPVYATVAWLVWVLSQQVGPAGLFAALDRPRADRPRRLVASTSRRRRRTWGRRLAPRHGRRIACIGRRRPSSPASTAPAAQRPADRLRGRLRALHASSASTELLRRATAPCSST